MLEFHSIYEKHRPYNPVCTNCTPESDLKVMQWNYLICIGIFRKPVPVILAGHVHVQCKPCHLAKYFQPTLYSTY